MDSHVPVAGNSTYTVRPGRNGEMKEMEYSDWGGSRGGRGLI